MFTRDLGKISAILKGARKAGSGLSSVSGTFCLLESVVYFKESREIQLVSQVNIIKRYDSILGSLDKIGQAYVAFELINKCLPAKMENRELFDSLKRFLDELNDSVSDDWKYLLGFQLRFAGYLGLIHYDGTDLSETFFDNLGFMPSGSETEALKSLHGNGKLSDRLKEGVVSGLCRKVEKHILEQSGTGIFQKTRRVLDRL